MAYSTIPKEAQSIPRNYGTATTNLKAPTATLIPAGIEHSVKDIPLTP